MNWPRKRKRQPLEDSPRPKHASQVARCPNSRRPRSGLGKVATIAGIENGALYQLAASDYDLCFTRDAEFSRRVMSKPATRLKLVHVVIPQTRQDEFVQQFLTTFLKTDWPKHNNGDDWPAEDPRY